MSQELEWAALFRGIGILCIPLIAAIPLRLIWRSWVGQRFEDKQYRARVEAYLKTGLPLESFREELTQLAGELRIRGRKAWRIETERLHPLGLAHFILLPALIFFPIFAVIGLPVIALGIPVLLLVEYLLIRKRGLISAMKLSEKIMGFSLAHIPKNDWEHGIHGSELEGLEYHIKAFHSVPRVVFLGLFAWLIVTWIFNLENIWFEIAVSGILYIVLLSTIGVLSTAFDADLSFIHTGSGSITPIETWLETMLKPLIGIGLIVLLGKDLLHEARDGNPVLFSLTVLVALYGATVVGLAFQYGYGIARGSRARTEFIEQVIEQMHPISYDLVSRDNQVVLEKRMMMSERIELGVESSSQLFGFDPLQNLKRASPKREGSLLVDDLSIQSTDQLDGFIDSSSSNPPANRKGGEDDEE